MYNAVFIPMLTYGMESASLSQHDLHRLEAFHSKALRKMRRIPATFYTRILEPTQPTTTNQQLREQTSQPPLTHHIHRAQLEMFGHILGAQDKCSERECCFTKAFIYRSGTPGDGLRRGRPRIHWAEQCAVLVWHWLQELDPHPTQAHPTFPFAYVHLHRLAARRHFWSQLAGSFLSGRHTLFTLSEVHRLCVPELESRCRRLPRKNLAVITILCPLASHAYCVLETFGFLSQPS